MARVDGMEAAPLLSAERAQQEVGRGAPGPKTAVARVDKAIHALQFRMQSAGQCGAVERRPVQLPGPREGWSGRTAWKPAQRKDSQLHHALEEGGTGARGTPPPEPRLEQRAGAAHGEHEMLDNLLCAPATIVRAGMQLAPRCGLAGECGAPVFVHLL